MNLIKNFLFKIDDFLKSLSFLDFEILFKIRIYLFFIFWGAGTSSNKLSWNDGMPSVNPRFAEFLGPGGSDNLNFVFPTFAWLVILAEAGGAILLLLGLFADGLTFTLSSQCLLRLIFIFQWMECRRRWIRNGGYLYRVLPYLLSMEEVIIFLWIIARRK